MRLSSGVYLFGSRKVIAKVPPSRHPILSSLGARSSGESLSLALRQLRRQRFWQVNGVDKLVFRVGGGSSVCGEEPRRLALAALRAFFSLG